MHYLIIDVREPYEYKAGHVKNAVNIPLQNIIKGGGDLLDMPKDTKLIVYCRSGNRSGIAKEVLEAKGFKNVKNGINKEQVEAGLKS